MKFFLVNPFRAKITSRVFWINFLSKTESKMPKNYTVVQCFWQPNLWMVLNIIDPFSDEKLIQNTLEVIFYLKEFTKTKSSAHNSNFQQKWLWHNLVAKKLKNFFDLWSTQKYTKVSKICFACTSIFRTCSSQQC